MRLKLEYTSSFASCKLPSMRYIDLLHVKPCPDERTRPGRSGMDRDEQGCAGIGVLEHRLFSVIAYYLPPYCGICWHILGRPAYFKAKYTLWHILRTFFLFITGFSWMYCKRFINSAYGLYELCLLLWFPYEYIRPKL